jgi:hypothetical protein
LVRWLFATSWRGFLLPCAAETECARFLGARHAENLCGAISWLTFLLRPKRSGALTGVERGWCDAQAWLRNQMTNEECHEPSVRDVSGDRSCLRIQAVRAVEPSPRATSRRCASASSH